MKKILVVLSLLATTCANAQLFGSQQKTIPFEEVPISNETYYGPNKSTDCVKLHTEKFQATYDMMRRARYASDIQLNSIEYHQVSGAKFRIKALELSITTPRKDIYTDTTSYCTELTQEQVNFVVRTNRQHFMKMECANPVENIIAPAAKASKLFGGILSVPFGIAAQVQLATNADGMKAQCEAEASRNFINFSAKENMFILEGTKPSTETQAKAVERARGEQGPIPKYLNPPVVVKLPDESVMFNSTMDTPVGTPVGTPLSHASN